MIELKDLLKENEIELLNMMIKYDVYSNRWLGIISDSFLQKLI